MIPKADTPSSGALLKMLGERAERTSAPGGRRSSSDRESGRVLDLIAYDCETADHDVAALTDGSLSEDGIERLVDHVYGCERCEQLLSTVGQELLEVETTGEHGPASPNGGRPR
jgi:hypothetical protein